jgi:hypothetical protein
MLAPVPWSMFEAPGWTVVPEGRTNTVSNTAQRREGKAPTKAEVINHGEARRKCKYLFTLIWKSVTQEQDKIRTRPVFLIS